MKFEHLRGWMAGEDAVVVGCGPSATHDIADPESCGYPPPGFYYGHWTVACNRAVQFALPDFAVCVEPKRDAEVWKVIREANPLICFTHVNPDFPRAVQIGTKDVRQWLQRPDWEGKPFGNPEPLRLSQSPFFAAAIALYLGFETVGLIGVDYTPDRYADISREEKAWTRLSHIANDMGSRLVNLSEQSRLQALERGSWADIRCK